MNHPVTLLWLSDAQPRAYRRIFVVRRGALRPDLGIIGFLHHPTLACWHFAVAHPTKILSPSFVHVPLEFPPNDSWAEKGVVRGLGSK